MWSSEELLIHFGKCGHVVLWASLTTRGSWMNWLPENPRLLALPTPLSLLSYMCCWKPGVAVAVQYCMKELGSAPFCGWVVCASVPEGFPWGHASCVRTGLILTSRSCLLHLPFLLVQMSSPLCCFALPESACKLCQLLASTALGKSKSSSFWFVVWLSCWGNPPHRLSPGELCLEKITIFVVF